MKTYTEKENANYKNLHAFLMSFDADVRSQKDFAIGISEEQFEEYKQSIKLDGISIPKHDTVFGTIYKLIVLPKTYTEKELVSFGNYLLSQQRKDNFLPSAKEQLNRKERLRFVYDSDLANWKEEVFAK